MDRFTQHLESAIPQLRQQILEEFRNQQTSLGFRSAWEHFEEVIDPIFIRFLQQPPLSIPRGNIKEAGSKSVYPDLKIIFEGNQYAIDVKSGEDGKNPWYDMGRLDTYEERHINKYTAEYCVTVRWKGREPSTIVEVYIEPAYQSVGYRASYKGVLYRPYDGKIRPKSWDDFDNGVSHWKTEQDFKAGLEAAKMYRQMWYIVEWYRGLSDAQRKEIQKAITAIDKGQPVKLFNESISEEPATPDLFGEQNNEISS